MLLIGLACYCPLLLTVLVFTLYRHSCFMTCEAKPIMADP